MQNGLSAANPLATEKVTRLMLKFTVPAIISMLVSAAYNIADQIFIGQGVGMLGNAATNVAFPITTMCTALSLLLGVGAASNFNLNLGAGRREEAGHMAGTGLVMMVVVGLGLATLVLLLLRPLLQAFGATEEIFPYALDYTSITALGIPLLIFATASSHLIRADGSPTYAMLCNLSGALLNIALDPLFIFVFDLGIAGAAWATVLSQLLAATLAWRYFRRFRTLRLSRDYLCPRLSYLGAICRLGIANFSNHIVMMIVQITMNNVLRYYGALSVYGSEIPLACVGVITKVNFILIGVAVGLAQGCQPIFGFNYGARNYRRVIETYRKAAAVVLIFSFLCFLCFQLFPRQIVSIFGAGSELYFHFAERYFRIFLLMAFAIGLQPLTANFFTSIGKARYGIFMSLTRQGLFLLPLVIFLPRFLGIDGVMYAGPIADAAAIILAVIFSTRELKQLRRLAVEQEAATAV